MCDSIKIGQVRFACVGNWYFIASESLLVHAVFNTFITSVVLLLSYDPNHDFTEFLYFFSTIIIGLACEMIASH